MTGQQWLSSFIESLAELEEESNTNKDAEWTRFMVKVMKLIGKKTNNYVISKDPDNKRDSGEYLNIDALFIDNLAYDNWNSEDWDPPVLPSAAVELENNDSFEKITYCLWKILCLRAEVRVLICYQKNEAKIAALKRHLEDTIKSRNLMERDEEELFIIIGDENKENAEWEDYFNILEWRAGYLGRIGSGKEEIEKEKKEKGTTPFRE